MPDGKYLAQHSQDCGDRGIKIARVGDLRNGSRSTREAKGRRSWQLTAPNAETGRFAGAAAYLWPSLPGTFGKRSSCGLGQWSRPGDQREV
jgi:hypothetical protein